jgi:phosphoglycolate phosphatase
MSASPPIVLWDVDGTLLRAAKAGTRSFKAALATVLGAPFPTTPLDLGGRTDPQIARTILAAAGCADESVVAMLLAEVEAEYARREDEFAADTEVLDGVAETIAALDGHGAVQGLVTGNLESVARRKVRAAGLGAPLRFDVGGYGSDHVERAELVAIAMRRATAAGITVDPARVWIIGDTRRDLACAEANGVRCALVATGTTPFEVLAGLGADITLASLDAPEVAELVELIVDPLAVG